MNYIRSLLGAAPTTTRHRIYAQVRWKSQLDPLLGMTSVTNVPLILNFSAPWCKTCLEQGPVVLEALHAVEAPLNYVEVKADEPEMSEYLMRFGVKTFPTLVCIRREFMAGDLQIRSDMQPDEMKQFFIQQAALGAKDRGE